VQKHLRDWVRQAQGDLSSTQPEYDRFCVYFNLDGGTGKIRGICQQGNAAVGPIFKAWMKPFEDIGMKTAAISDIGGGDNYAFIRVGLPSFGFIQDPIEYETRTCHTSADVYERLQPDDLRFNAAVVASFAWQAAHRDAKLPRIPPHF
jgi:Zn-dependent M28 family amino/carboxypeptidase